jgi:hypothetical protein
MGKRALGNLHQDLQRNSRTPAGTPVKYRVLSTDYRVCDSSISAAAVVCVHHIILAIQVYTAV